MSEYGCTLAEVGVIVYLVLWAAGVITICAIAWHFIAKYW